MCAALPLCSAHVPPAQHSQGVGFFVTFYLAALGVSHALFTWRRHYLMKCLTKICREINEYLAVIATHPAAPDIDVNSMAYRYRADAVLRYNAKDLENVNKKQAEVYLEMLKYGYFGRYGALENLRELSVRVEVLVKRKRSELRYFPKLPLGLQYGTNRVKELHGAFGFRVYLSHGDTNTPG